MTVPREMLRELVREAITAALATQPAPPAPPQAATGAAQPPPSHDGPLPDAKVEDVRLTGDGDLHQFVLRLLDRAQSQHFRRQLQTGALRFRLVGGPAATGGRPPAETVVEKGAVTERLIREAAESGCRVRLGPAAVLTPLARDAARQLGVAVVVEKRKGR